MNEISMTLVKLQANVLKEFLEAGCGVGISYGAAYNAVARIHGYQSWNELAAELKNTAMDNASKTVEYFPLEE